MQELISTKEIEKKEYDKINKKSSGKPSRANIPR
jgi:hypothetical protein